MNAKLKGFQFIEVWDSEVTHEEKERRFQQLLDRIEAEKGEEHPYIEAMHMVNNGAAIASGKWKIQKDRTGNILIGQLKETGEHEWIDPYYYPPIFHNLKWHVTKKSDI